MLNVVTIVRIQSDLNAILSQLERFGISVTEHGQSDLLSHLKGTYAVLRNWDCPEYLCLAGLCHSIYGTESFSKTPATLDDREYVQTLIGKEAERLAYLFGAHRKETLWENLDRGNAFSVQDRFLDQVIHLSKVDVSDLIAITLANWLEQRPRSKAEHQFIRKEEFLRSKSFLPAKAYEAFIEAYGLAGKKSKPFVLAAIGSPKVQEIHVRKGGHC